MSNRDSDFIMLGGKAARKARRGRVRLDRRVWMDDDGPFRPLGGTLMWALRGQKFERERIGQNRAHLSKHGFDSSRILCEVGWSGNEVDPTWPDYDNIVAGYLDDSYNIDKMRTELCVIGGGTSYDPIRLCERLVDIVKGREHTVLMWEATNERHVDLNTMREMVKILQRTGIPVAATSEECRESDPDDIVDETRADVATMHTDRDIVVSHDPFNPYDSEWRQVRQGWGYQELWQAQSRNEPPGPKSSIKQNIDPLQLGIFRAIDMTFGAGAWVLHNGAGVAGRVDSYHNRPANLWEVPNIDVIEDAVRSVDDLIPAGVENWPRHENTWWGNNPVYADSGTSVGEPHGVNCLKTAVTSDQFLGVGLGVKNRVVITSRWGCQITATLCSAPYIFGPMTRAVVADQRLEPGQSFAVNGPDDAHAAVIIHGMR